MNLCICSHLLPKGASLMMTTGKATYPCVQQNTTSEQFFFFLPVYDWFYSNSLGYNYQFLTIQAVQSFGSLSWHRPQVNQKLVGHSYKYCTTFAPISCKQDRLYVEDCVAELVSSFLFQQTTEYLSAPKRLEHRSKGIKASSLSTSLCAMRCMGFDPRNRATAVAFPKAALCSIISLGYLGLSMGPLSHTTTLHSATESQYWNSCLATKFGQFRFHMLLTRITQDIFTRITLINYRMFPLYWVFTTPKFPPSSSLSPYYLPLLQTPYLNIPAHIPFCPQSTHKIILLSHYRKILACSLECFNLPNLSGPVDCSLMIT